ncbi:hypothetical protein Hanom_Chr15g01356611 [Helianthus anomalus]
MGFSGTASIRIPICLVCFGLCGSVSVQFRSRVSYLKTMWFASGNGDAA